MIFCSLKSISRAILVAAAASPLAWWAVGGSIGEEIRTSPNAVVELFTSQGCASCPPADELLGELSARRNVVALAYHVDYWDYIGWADTFADPAYSDLQRSYASSWGKSRIYTPQLIINGTRGLVGSRRAEIEEALSEAELPLEVGLIYADGVLAVRIGGNEDYPESSIWLVTYRSEADVDISRGENRGHSITYVQIVTSRQVLGMWEPKQGAALRLPLSDVLSGESDGVAIVVQQQKDGLPGPIIGAALFEM
ncbi:MAG TPA: DUF1223 domain-containing protein [Devosia sp.]|nr:DUF1223 domain-containing protein [Devosia sp.]